MEIFDYATYHQPHGAVRHHGIRAVAGRYPHAVQPGVLTLAWGAWCARSPPASTSSSTQIDGIPRTTPGSGTLRHPRRVRSPAGTTAACLRSTRHEGRARQWSSSSTSPVCAPDLGPDWPHRRAGLLSGGDYRVNRLYGRYAVDGHRWRPQHRGGLKATAMRLVNAVSAVVDATPGWSPRSTCPRSSAEVSSSPSWGRLPRRGSAKVPAGGDGGRYAGAHRPARRSRLTVP